MTFSEAGPVPAQGRIAQQVFWYTTFTADMIEPGLAVVNADGTPKWRMAPSPHGPYWSEGMKLGYQDTGAWTLLESTPLERRKAAWLYAQFVVSKTVSLKKTLVGLTPIRESDLAAQAMTEAAPRLGGLVEFYRSPARVAWTPTGSNVPDYPKLACRQRAGEPAAGYGHAGGATGPGPRAAGAGGYSGRVRSATQCARRSRRLAGAPGSAQSQAR
jgi:glycerol transport system substrate-binding protein